MHEGRGIPREIERSPSEMVWPRIKKGGRVCGEENTKAGAKNIYILPRTLTPARKWQRHSYMLVAHGYISSIRTYIRYFYVNNNLLC